MITSSILMVVLKIVSPLVSLFKPINVLVNSTFISYVFDVVSGVLYFLPVGTINTILGITLATWVIRVIIAFLRALWGILPIVEKKGCICMIKAFIAIFAGFWDLLKFPLLYLGILALVFLVLLGIFFSQEWLSGRRPAPTSVRYVQRPGLFKSLFYMTPRQMVEDWFSKPADFFNPQGLIIFTGRQGRGKTIAMAEYILHLQESYPLCKVLTNFAYLYEDDELKHWRQLTDYKNDVKGVVVGIDEMQNWFSSNQSKNFPPEMLAVITQNRKNRRLILGTAQNFYLLAKAIRSQATEVRECVTFFGCLTFVSRKEAILDDKGDVKEWKRRGFYYFVHTKKIRSSYDTYRVIDSLVDSGFKDEVHINIEQL